MKDWSDLEGWWLQQLSDDPAYGVEIQPFFRELLAVEPGDRILDLGTGTGWALEELIARNCTGIGVELNPNLARRAVEHGPTVIARLPALRWLQDEAVDGVTAVLVLEHISDLETLFTETARVTRRSGTFTLIINHPQITAPGSAPIVDPIDGEVYWRWGEYLREGLSEEPAGEDTVTFHHRPLGILFSTASNAGWMLEVMVERGMSKDLVGDDPLLVLQQGLPRLLGVRWRRA